MAGLRRCPASQNVVRPVVPGSQPPPWYPTVLVGRRTSRLPRYPPAQLSLPRYKSVRARPPWCLGLLGRLTPPLSMSSMALAGEYGVQVCHPDIFFSAINLINAGFAK
jgi:hypothetical protein